MKEGNMHNEYTRSIVSVILGMIGFHILVISYVIQSKPLLYLTLADFIAAILLGARSDNSLGHAGVIAGIAAVLVTLFLMIS